MSNFMIACALLNISKNNSGLKGLLINHLYCWYFPPPNSTNKWIRSWIKTSGCANAINSPCRVLNHYVNDDMASVTLHV